MKSFSKRIRLYIKLFAGPLEKWRWVILAFMGLSLLWVEIQEFFVLRVLDQPFHYFEVFQYAVLLISTGLLIELFARSNRANKQVVKILEFKHRLSLDFTNTEDWKSLIQKLASLPSRITDVDETYLLISDPLNGKLEIAGHWIEEEQPAQAPKWDPRVQCRKCLDKSFNNQAAFHICSDHSDASSYLVYSLEVSNPNIPTTVLKFRVKPAAELSRNEEDVFTNIRDEIVAALHANQDRKRLSEMQSAEVAMAERRMVSAYVHDQLGQNLGYLHLKLDQLGVSPSAVMAEDVRKDLKHLQEVANESYEIVRDILKKIQPETIPHLTNLLREHARVVSHRANLALNFKSTGSPILLATGTQQIIFFTFREILSNVEKHADASKVEVVVNWQNGLLDISVADDGKGFDPSLVKGDEHFGLGIMQERISNVKGKLMINSSNDSGTVVSITLPLESTKEVL